MYQDLLRVKQHREQSANQALRTQQQLVLQQTKIIEQARGEVERFQTDRLIEEKNDFAALKGQAVPLSRIETMNNKAAEMREREALLRNRILEEEQKLDTLRQALDRARQRQLAAVRAREKFEQFAAQQQLIVQQALDRREENELEEIASANHQARQGEAW